MGGVRVGSVGLKRSMALCRDLSEMDRFNGNKKRSTAIASGCRSAKHSSYRSAWRPKRAARLTRGLPLVDAASQIDMWALVNPATAALEDIDTTTAIQDILFVLPSHETTIAPKHQRSSSSSTQSKMASKVFHSCGLDSLTAASTLVGGKPSMSLAFPEVDEVTRDLAIARLDGSRLPQPMVSIRRGTDRLVFLE